MSDLRKKQVPFSNPDAGIVNLKNSLDEFSPLTSHFWVVNGPSFKESLG